MGGRLLILVVHVHTFGEGVSPKNNPVRIAAAVLRACCVDVANGASGGVPNRRDGKRYSWRSRPSSGSYSISAGQPPPEDFVSEQNPWQKMGAAFGSGKKVDTPPLAGCCTATWGLL